MVDQPETEQIAVIIPCSRCLVKKENNQYDTNNGTMRRTCRTCLTYIRSYRRNQRAKLGDTQVVCECGSTIVANAMVSHRRSRKHVMAINGLQDKPKKVAPTKVECPCGSVILRSSIYNHRHSLRHKAWLEQVAAAVEDVEFAKREKGVH